MLNWLLKILKKKKQKPKPTPKKKTSKKIKKPKNQEAANKQLLNELTKAKETHRIKSQPKEKKEAPIKPLKKTLKENQTKKEPSREQLAANLSSPSNTILYIKATVKQIKLIEWRQGKKKILLNKEREIRHTHKGGWSQEKFQRFVESQKSKATSWFSENLQKKGVLRPPYDKIIIDSKKYTEELKKITKDYKS